MGRKKTYDNLPSFDELIIPTLKSLLELGGSGTIEEINTKVYEIENFSDEILQIPHGEDGGINEVAYRLSWSRTYLKKYGLLENSARGIWALAKTDFDITKLDYNEIVRKVKEDEKQKQLKPAIDKEIIEEVETTEEWKEKLLNILYEITPAAFERLAQRILRESGLLSFHVIFQCKRYKGSVTPSQIRDFRGAMQGRADKGLVITTGAFTREALKEATRDGAPPIDLIDGELLCDKLKELKLGLDTKMTETVEIKSDWFKNI